jgi:hypothetical protein
MGEGKIDPKRPWVSFDAQLNPHSKGEPTVRPTGTVDPTRIFANPGAGTPNVPINKPLEKQ